MVSESVVGRTYIAAASTSVPAGVWAYTSPSIELGSSVLLAAALAATMVGFT